VQWRVRQAPEQELFDLLLLVAEVSEYKLADNADETIKKIIFYVLTDEYSKELPFIQSVAESHGGTVVADSALERGTTFTISVPIDARPYATKS
jgi:hypothetical protein